MSARSTSYAASSDAALEYGGDTRFVDEAGFAPGGQPQVGRMLAEDAREMELAAELLSLTHTAEMEQFFGNLVGRVVNTSRAVLRTPAGQQAVKLMRDAARTALPKIGQAVGSHFGGQRGGAVGSDVGRLAGTLLGLELEGLSEEDSEFEVARQLVRLGTATARGLRMGPPTAAYARNAFRSAARRYAPGLFPTAVQARAPARWPATTTLQGFAREGRWVRRGNVITLL